MCLFSVFSMGKPRKYKVRCRDSPKWSKLIARSITKVCRPGFASALNGFFALCS